MPQIRPITDLRNTNEISEICHSKREPVFITKNGYGDMVIMSVEMYESTMKRLNMYYALELSEQQIVAEKTKDARQSLGKLREKYEV